MTRPLVSRKGQREKGELQEERQASCCSSEKPKSGPKPETECFYCKQTGHWKWNCPKYLADKKDGKVNKGILDIHVIDVYLLVFIATPQYLILVQLLKSSNSKRELDEHKLVKDEVTMCIGSGSKIDMIIIARSLHFRD